MNEGRCSECGVTDELHVCQLCDRCWQKVAGETAEAEMKPCGCYIRIIENGKVGAPRIVYCPMHSAVEEMLERLKAMHDGKTLRCKKYCGLCVLIAKASQPGKGSK